MELTQKKRKSGIYKIYNPQKGDQSKDLAKTKHFIIQSLKNCDLKSMKRLDKIQDQFHKDKKNLMRKKRNLDNIEAKDCEREKTNKICST